MIKNVQDGKIISTHTSLAGRDENSTEDLTQEVDFYSHVPRGT